MLKKTKSYEISKRLFVRAFEHVKANKGTWGIDKESIEHFETNLNRNLYKLWNRMSSGCYFPPAVRAVEIPKKCGGKRTLGIPTVGDRVAQMVVKIEMESGLEKIFLPDSYGYRPNKSALDAIDITRRRCWRYSWVLEFDIKGLFDNIPHELLMKAVIKHTDKAWVRLYIERWLKSPIQYSDGEVVLRNKGTPQGGVISPVLSNLFLHYAFDLWMNRNHKNKPWCRYADDGLVHCKTEYDAQTLLNQLSLRFKECGLELHPEKTKVVYCKDSNRKAKYKNVSFDFLGYTFRPRKAENEKEKKYFTTFSPAVSKTAVKQMRSKVRKLRLHNQTELSLPDIAKRINPVLRGWFNYYGKHRKSEMNQVWRHVNQSLNKWARRKYKKIKGKTASSNFLSTVAENSPFLFIHWHQAGYIWFA